MISKHPQLPLFVYGTLLPGQPNYALLQGYVMAHEPAWFENGRLYDMGYYPMMVEQPGCIVKGAVLTLHPRTYEQIINNLDSLEGYNPLNLADSMYHRLPRVVKTANGRSLAVWVYLVQTHQVTGLEAIDSGDWAGHLTERETRRAAWRAMVRGR